MMGIVKCFPGVFEGDLELKVEPKEEMTLDKALEVAKSYDIDDFLIYGQSKTGRFYFIAKNSGNAEINLMLDRAKVHLHEMISENEMDEFMDDELF